MTHPADHFVEIDGFSVPFGSCVIHFYYSRAERQRFAGFLLNGVLRRQGVILACTRDGYEALTAPLGVLGVSKSDLNIVTIEITPDLRQSIARIAEAAEHALGENGAQGRLLVDFGTMVGQESIFELEGALHSALTGMKLVTLTQYDGGSFTAPITIEQFQTHALAIVGNAFYRENQNYTPPETYFRKRAAGARK